MSINFEAWVGKLTADETRELFQVCAENLTPDAMSEALQSFMSPPEMGDLIDLLQNILGDGEN